MLGSKVGVILEDNVDLTVDECAVVNKDNGRAVALVVACVVAVEVSLT